MASDFDDSGVGRDVKWVLVVVGLLMLCCVVITVIYVFKRAVEKRRRQADSAEVDRDYEAATYVKKILLAEHYVRGEVKVDNSGVEVARVKPPVFKGLELLIKIQEDLVKERREAERRRLEKIDDKKYTKLVILTLNGCRENLPGISALLMLFSAYYKTATVVHGLQQAKSTEYIFTDNILLVILDAAGTLEATTCEVSSAASTATDTATGTVHDVLDKMIHAGSRVVVVHDAHPTVPGLMVRCKCKLTGGSDRGKYSYVENRGEDPTGDVLLVKQVEGVVSEYIVGSLLTGFVGFFKKNFVNDGETYLDLVRHISASIVDVTAKVQVKSTRHFAPATPIPLVFPATCGTPSTTHPSSLPDAKVFTYQSPYIVNPLESVFPLAPRKHLDAEWMTPHKYDPSSEREWMYQ